MAVIAEPSDARDPERFDPAVLAPWLKIARDAAPVEHAVLTDGWRRIRLDVVSGSLAEGHPVHLRYQIEGTASAETKLLPLRRLLHLYRHRVFAPALYPHVRSIDYALTVLRVHDATQAGASQKDIARALFGNDRIVADWHSDSDFLRSRIRRLVANARRKIGGDFKTLLSDERTTTAAQICSRAGKASKRRVRYLAETPLDRR